MEVAQYLNIYTKRNKKSQHQTTERSNPVSRRHGSPATALLVVDNEASESMKFPFTEF